MGGLVEAGDEPLLRRRHRIEAERVVPEPEAELEATLGCRRGDVLQRLQVLPPLFLGESGHRHVIARDGQDERVQEAEVVVGDPLVDEVVVR
jgi:hypothetical protein